LGRSAENSEQVNRGEAWQEKVLLSRFASLSIAALLPYFFAHRFSRCAPTNGMPGRG